MQNQVIQLSVVESSYFFASAKYSKKRRFYYSSKYKKRRRGKCLVTGKEDLEVIFFICTFAATLSKQPVTGCSESIVL